MSRSAAPTRTTRRALSRRRASVAKSPIRRKPSGSDTATAAPAGSGGGAAEAAGTVKGEAEGRVGGPAEEAGGGAVRPKGAARESGRGGKHVPRASVLGNSETITQRYVAEAH